MKNVTDKLNRPQVRAFLAVFLALTILYIWQAIYSPAELTTYRISYSRFMDQLDADNVGSVTIEGRKVNGIFRSGKEIRPDGMKEPVNVKHFLTHLPEFQGEDLIGTMRGKGVDITVKPAEDSALWQALISLLPWILIIGIWIAMMKRASKQMGGGPGGLFSFGQSKAKLYDISKPDITFSDVAGMENVKKEMAELIEFLKDPERFRSMGAKIPKGVILVGPPGTGKTLLARATAGEAGVPFYSISGSEFMEMFVGVGASRVRDMFKKAKSSKPCIIFIDEIDAIGRTRGAGLGGGHDEREQTLNQLLSEMDGFEPNEGVIIMAATNRPDVLDQALLRPGRFDRRVMIDRPGWKERKAILEVHVKGKKLAGDVDLEAVARGTPGMTGADLENIANEAALTAVRNGSERIHMRDFDEAREKIVMGTVRDESVNDKEKRITAYHESGHTLVAWFLPGADPIHKVSIIPRGMSMGATQLLPEEDRHYYPRSYLMNRLSVSLSGRLAEKLVFSETSTGAQNDLKEATSLAEKMVAQWGMSEKVGPINLGMGEEHPFLGREIAQQKRHSEDMAWIVDQEIQKLIGEAESKALSILREKKNILEALAETLLREESLEKDEIENLIQESEQRTAEKANA